MPMPIIPVLEHYGGRGITGETGNQKIRCPFHDDTQASASVNVEKGLFLCFTCDARGDGIALIMYQEGLEYPGAARFAEETLGIDSEVVSAGTPKPERRTSLRISNRGARTKRGNSRPVRRRLR